MKIDFSGKTVLVTGATRGIGKQLADDFRRLGANLILTGTNCNQIDSLNKEGVDKYICVDFLDVDSVNNFIAVIREIGKIDICVNNAGINRIDYLWDIDIKDWDDIINVNLKGSFITGREVSKLMVSNGYGRIVNISSISGVVSWEKRCAYTASKSGLIGLTRSMAIELAPYNVLVNSVSPGFTWTELTKSILTDDDIELLQSKVPMGRFATTDEISRVVLFLASDLNTFIVGQNIIVDGGYVST